MRLSVLCSTLAASLTVAALPGGGPVQIPGLFFSFDSAFGDNMVLQQAPAAAAVYGFLDYAASMSNAVVSVTMTPDSGAPTTVVAKLNTTSQSFGTDWGVRPCPSCPAIAGPFNPWNSPLASWKVLLPPTPAGANTYTISVSCVGCSADAPTTATISNVVFGDMWYCTGQSNMWLPVLHTYQRNETARNISALGKYSNIRLMAGSSGNAVRTGPSLPPKPASVNVTVPWPTPYGSVNGTNPWMTAAQAAPAGCVEDGSCPFFNMGGSCWYFAQGLADLGVTTPIGIVDTAIGGQRIEEFMPNASVNVCSDRSGMSVPWWDAQLYGTQVLPFVDMTVKGFLWYQGENNMNALKGNSAANTGYSCLMRELIKGFRAVWSATPGTTDPLAYFGAVALPSGGSEGADGPGDMGPMRVAQTAGYGVLPNADLPNTWIVQAYDLEDEWGSGSGPCFGGKVNWACCPDKSYNSTSCAGREALCAPACDANADTAIVMGGIHPRSKQPVGQRLALGAFNSAYGGTGAVTGPTIASCSLAGATLSVAFDTGLLKGDTVLLQPIFPVFHGHYWNSGGSLMWAQNNASLFCSEAQCVVNATSGRCTDLEFCPTWAGGDGVTTLPAGTYDSNWINLDFKLSASGTGVDVDLSPLNGTAPTALKYAFDLLFCCDMTDPTLYVTHGCIQECPIMSSSRLPANPFIAKVVGNACECIAPQVCN